MKRSLFVLLIALFAAACSTPRPAQQPDKVRSGADTAKTAADAARKAEADDNTGLIMTSSEDAEPTTQPTTMQSQPRPDLSNMTPTLRVKFVKGTLTQAGEPIVNFEQVCKDAVATDPKTVLVVDADASTKHAQVMEAIDTAKAAGIQKFSLSVTDDDGPKDDEASKGKLTVYSEPAAPIVVDNAQTGDTSPATISLEPGKHTIQMKFDSGLSEKKVVDVKEGSRIKLFFRDKTKPEKADKTKKDEGKDSK